MIIAALVCYAALVVAWMIAPDSQRPAERAVEPRPTPVDFDSAERLAA
jgi:hypothetical protein